MAIWQDLVDRPRLHRPAIRASSASSASCAARHARKPAPSSSPQPGEEAQVDYGDGPMVRDPNTRQVPPHAAVRADARLQPQIRSPADLPIQLAHLGRAARDKPSAGWAASPASSCSTTCAKACSRPTSTIPRSIRSTATCWPTTAPSPCRAACAIRIARARSNPASATRRRRR